MDNPGSTQNVPNLLMKLQILRVFLLAVFFLSACNQESTPAEHSIRPSNLQQLNIFADASLTDAFTEIGEQFEAQNPDVKIVFNFAGSQQLAQQLSQRASADVFASAKFDQLQVAAQANHVDSEQMKIFASNRLIIISALDSKLPVRRVQDLLIPGLKLVLGAQDEAIGQYTLEFLDNASQYATFGAEFKTGVFENVILYEENVREMLNKVQKGEVDAGIVYISDVIGDAGTQVGTVTIPDPLNITANYYIAPVIDGQPDSLAEQFIAFVLSIEGQDILAKYQFTPVQ